MGTNKNGESNEDLRSAIPDESVTLELYAKNPFRVIGARVDATIREIDLQFQRAQIEAEFGGDRKLGKGLLAPSPQPTIGDLQEAHQKLRDPQGRIVNEFFWFWPVAANGATADPLAAIATGRLQEAIRVWSEQDGGDNPVARHNLAVLFSLLALDLERVSESNPLSSEQVNLLARYWQAAIRYWCFLFQNESLWSRFTLRIKELDDPQLKEDFAGRFRQALPKALLRIHAAQAIKAAERTDSAQVQRQRDLIDAYEQPRELVIELFEELLEPFGEQIKALCETARSKAADPNHGFDAANTLIAESAPVLRLINTFLPLGNASRDYASDEVALQSFDCAVGSLNKSQEWEKGIALLQTLTSLAASEGARERLRTNLAQADLNAKGAREAAEAQKIFGTCWYCSKQDKDDSSTKELKLFGDVKRDGNTTHFKILPLKIPRCKSCKNKHLLAQLITIPLTLCLVAVPTVVLGGALLFVVAGLAESFKGAGWLGLVLILFALGLVRTFFGRLPYLLQAAHRLASSIVPLAGTKHEFNVNGFPTVNNALRNGFQLGSRP